MALLPGTDHLFHNGDHRALHGSMITACPRTPPKETVAILRSLQLRILLCCLRACNVSPCLGHICAFASNMQLKVLHLLGW